MFAGIVHAVGRVESNASGRLRVRAGRDLLRRARAGSSVAVNGVCLTVVSRGSGVLGFDLSPETLSRTNLGGLGPGDPANLEPSLRLGDELGGHFVSGHVDAAAEVLETQRVSGGGLRLRVSLPAALAPLVAVKGSIAVDGTSLTVTRVGADGLRPGGALRGRGWFEAALIPYTLRRTTLGKIAPGRRVNLEADLLARYLLGLLRSQRGK